MGNKKNGRCRHKMFTNEVSVRKRQRQKPYDQLSSLQCNLSHYTMQRNIEIIPYMSYAICCNFIKPFNFTLQLIRYNL